MRLRSCSHLLRGLVFLTLTIQTKQKKLVPSLEHSLTGPVVRMEGADALLTCVVRSLNNFTIMWKKTEKEKVGPKILTANGDRVTSDQRFDVLHEEGGDVYVLLIQNTTMKDAGLYICEVNSDPPIRSFHQLSFLSSSLQAPESTLTAPSEPETNSSEPTSSSPDSLSVWGYSTPRPIQHDYTDCCLSKNVSTTCLGFCNLKSILDGDTGSDPVECETDFPGIASCMADGRDHMPCCSEAGIPDVCTDLCRGEYTVQTDNIKTHFSCAAFTAPTLACIAAGIDLLPGPPQDLSVSAENETSIRVSWSLPSTDPELTKQFVLNVTYIQFLSPIFSVNVDSRMARKFYPPFSKLHRLSPNTTSFVLTELETFSLYEVYMWTEGVNQGKSLPTYKTKVVTHIEGDKVADSPTFSPEIPDVKQCCRNKNVSHESCVDMFCDPHSMAEATVTDMMICAPWDTEIFSCLADGRDHTPCCSARQLPPLCQELCSGNVTDINFKYFRCISYMHDLSSCLLEGYGVLPSSPVNFRFSNLDTSFGILHWEPPATLGETVKDYIVSYQMMDETQGEKINLEHAQSPFILENLSSSTTYEVYVSAVNEHGAGEESSRIVFRTASRKVEDLKEVSHPYNESQCCINAGVKSECQPLCSYNAKMSDIEALGGLCGEDMSKVMRCLVGGRDHLPCCERRGVPQSCQPLCQAVHQKSTGAEFTKCLPFLGQVFTCLEEGTINLPPPVRGLRAVEVSDGKVVLSWRSDDTDSTFNTTHFEIYYKKLDDNSTGGTVFSSDNMINSTLPRATIENLETGKFYRFFVVARNDDGTSLPSSLVRLNVSQDAWDGKSARGTSSPPHLLEVEAHSATWLQFTWNPPAITHPEDVLKYKLFFRQTSGNSTEFVSVESDVTTVKVQNLTPNTQYILYTTAIIYNNDSDYTLTRSTQESEPSETLVAWTDPAFPAFVEVRIIKSSESNKFSNFAPTIHPINMVTEGSSMTVLCIAMGTPLPTVTLYINGHPVRSDVSRHMVTVIHNVTRDMGDVSCYADNGYGTPMQASRKITISRPPTVKAPAETSAITGDDLVINCKVDAFPAPTIAVFRDKELKQSIHSDDRISLSATGSSDDPAGSILELRIKDVTPEDGGKYYCHANNTLGEDVAFVGVNVSGLPPAVYDRTACCKQQNVSSDCLDICSFSIDFDTMLRKPYCLPEFHKLMKCASDGSDHRHCCHSKGVPNDCINWCRGQPVEKTEICALSQSREIIGCFHEGSKNLPSPPRNIVVRLTSKSSAMVFWEPPSKNPETVELYRVFWRPLGSKETMKNDTVETKLSLSNLVGGTTYELVVKAGNSNGTSHLTEPLRFATADEVIIETSMRRSSGATEVVGIIIAVVIVCAILGLVLLVLKKKNFLLPPKNPNSPTVSFENPFYNTREAQLSSPEVGQDSGVEISSSGSWQGEMETRNPSPLQDSESDRNPSLFSGIKFGRSGQGFQRFT